jgi:flagellar motor switch protein FliG
MAKKEDRDSIRIDGKKEASSLLAALDSGTRNRILSEIEKSDPALALTLKKGMARFEHLLALEPASFLKVIQAFPASLIGLATRGLEPDEEHLFFSKLSTRQGLAIREERDALGPRKKSEVDAAREKLLTHARSLHENGEITLFPGT